MIKGKKKGTFYIFCQINDQMWLETRQGWIKEGVGFHKGLADTWKITDINSGMAFAIESFDTLDAAWEHYLTVKEQFEELRETDKYKQKVQIFEKMIVSEEKNDKNL